MEIKNLETAVLPKNKIVADAPVARKLIKDGYRVVDIKAKKNSPRESVFVFEVVPGFMEKMGEYVAERKANKEEKKEEIK